MVTVTKDARSIIIHPEKVGLISHLEEGEKVLNEWILSSSELSR